MSQPADNPRTFNLTFRSFTDSVAPGVYAYMTVTRVDGLTGRALMMLNRHGGDRINRPVGLFTTTLSRPDMDAIAAAIAGIKWQSLPQPAKGDISAATLELEYNHGDQSLRYAFNASNFELLQALSPLMQQLDRLGGALLAHPERSMSVAVARSSAGFKLVLKNVGNGPIMIADPRPPAASSGTSRGVVGVAPDQDTASGFQPLPSFIPVPLKNATSGDPVVVLAPGQTLEAETLPWSPPAPGKYLAKASWTDYDGPVIDPANVMPMIPDPSEAQTDKRPYLIRGAVFSSYLEFTVK